MARLFEALRLPPLVAGTLLALLAVGATALVGWLSGDLAELRARTGGSWWRESRDARLAVLVAVLLAAVATATRQHALGTRQNLAAVARLGGWPVEDVDPAERPGNSSRERRAGLLGALLVPAVALLVDRDASVYFEPGYWYASKFWTWAVGILATTGAGILTWRVIRDARHFSALAERLPSLDLLDPAALAPFARQALRSAVPWLLLIGFIAANAMDRGFLWAVGVMGGLGLVGVAVSLAIPLRGIHARIRSAKASEVARVNAAIRGEPGALAGSLIERRPDASLADLLAYRAQIAAVPEWPVDVSTLVRVGFYVAIPVASWVAGALVERVVDAALG